MPLSPSTKRSLLLPRIRHLLQKHQLTAYIVPTADPHQSEYVSTYHARREFITGFTGSAGTAVIFDRSELGLANLEQDQEQAEQKPSLPGAFLWTDSRYDLQAKQELDLENWRAMIYPNPEPNYPEWFQENGPRLKKWIQQHDKSMSDEPQAPLKIGIDPQLLTVKEYRTLEEKLRDSGFTLQLIHDNLVDMLWEQQHDSTQEDSPFNRPHMPHEPIIVLDEKYCGRSVSDKLADLRTKMRKENCRFMITAMLDEIAWLLNLRGSDISYNPVFLSFALIDLKGGVTLYVPDNTGDRLTQNGIKEHLDKENVHVKQYDQFLSDLKNLNTQNDSSSEPNKIWISPESTNMAIYAAVKSNPIYEDDSYIEILKAIKNDTEIQGFRDCNIRDGAALCKFFAWLEKQLTVEKNTTITEDQAAEKLLSFRKEQPLFVSESFAPIVGFGSNGAIVHYHAKKGSSSTIGTDSMLLLDSGGQYKDGTTDTTRTMHFGEPSKEQRANFTRVLKGHIAMDDFVFPDGALSGLQLDIIARQFLWREGLDYGHGTGHLIGHFLNVHEGPAYIGYRNKQRGLITLKKGMVCSNEPGYYKADDYGIRIENDLVVCKAKTAHRVNNVDYLRFEHFTMVPIQTKLVCADMLTQVELKWLNSYNDEVLSKVGPLLKDDSEALEWLKKECAPLKSVESV